MLWAVHGLAVLRRFLSLFKVFLAKWFNYSYLCFTFVIRLTHLKPFFITHSLLFFLLIHLNLSPDAVLEPASGLGADLLGLYQRGEQCDITIQVAEQVFSCHRYKHWCRPFNPLIHTSGIQTQHLFFLCHQRWHAWWEHAHFGTSQPDVKKTPEVAHLLLTPASGGWSFSDAEVVVAAGNHGDRYLPVRAQGSSSQRELAALRQRAANSTEASQAPRPYCILQCSYVSWDTVNSTLTYITVTYVPRGIKHRACLPQTVTLFMKPILNDKWKTVFRNEHKTTHGNRFKDKSIILKF